MSVNRFVTEETGLTPSAKRSPVIEVFADIWCPFAHVGLSLVAELLRTRSRQDVGIWVRAWPLEWVNGRAMDPESALEHARELRHQVAPNLFRGVDSSTFPRSTIPALALAAHAYRTGMEVGQAVSLDLRDSLFENGRDVSDPALLAEIATTYGLSAPDPRDYETVVSDWQDGRARDVRGSPHFFCSGRGLFCPSLDIAKRPGGEGTTIHTDLGRLEAFLDECLAG
jgi:predicted DsbA family dithiol-disulfide isomerase